MLFLSHLSKSPSLPSLQGMSYHYLLHNLSSHWQVFCLNLYLGVLPFSNVLAAILALSNFWSPFPLLPMALCLGIVNFPLNTNFSTLEIPSFLISAFSFAAIIFHSSVFSSHILSRTCACSRLPLNPLYPLYLFYKPLYLACVLDQVLFFVWFFFFFFFSFRRLRRSFLIGLILFKIKVAILVCLL